MQEYAFRFDGKVAVVTGAGSGMGRAISHSLSHGGAQVVAVDINEASARETVASLPNAALAVQADVGDEASVQAYVQAAIDRFGRIDFFSNNAGILGYAGPFNNASAADYEQIFSVNVRGAFFGMRDIINQMLTQGGGGAIVTTASIAGLRGVVGCGLYSASKFAVLGMTRSVAKEYASRGIRANAICPAATETAFSALDDAMRAAQTANIPLGRIATPADMARAVTWLLSDAASFITGAVLPVDGGQTA